MIKAVVFDLDNTLMDFIARKEKSINSAIEAMIDAGLEVSFEKAKKEIYDIYSGHNMEDQLVFQKFLKKYNLDSNIKLVAKGVCSYRKTKIAETKSYPKVKNTLLKLIKNGYTIGIVSDAPKSTLWIRLTELGLEDFFDFVVSAEDAGSDKTTQLPFTFAKKYLKVKPENVLFVGDWPDRDLKGAKEAGFKTAFAVYGYYGGMLMKKVSKKEINKIVKEYKPDFVLNKFEDLLSVLEKQRG